MKKNKDIGIGIKSPRKSCNDKKCPFHGISKLRGSSFDGEVISKDTHRTTVVEWNKIVKVKKYERFENRRTKVKAHNPTCVNAQLGDKVKIVECRPLSKTKKFIIVKKFEE